MPIVYGGGAAAPAAGAPAPRPVAPSAPPIKLSSIGLPTGGGGVQLLEQAKRDAAHTSGMLDPLSGPVNRLLKTLSEPVYAVGSGLEGHFGEALKHLAHIPSSAASIAVPQLEELVNRIPGFKEHEFTLPSQALRGHGLMPSGILGSILGFGADVALDPLSYLTFGAGGALAHGAEAGLREAEATAARRVAEVAAEPKTTPGHFADLKAAQRAQFEAQAATRAARPAGARAGVGIAGTRRVKELGTIPGTGAISRGAGKVTAKLGSSERVSNLVSDFEKQFLTGGDVHNLSSYRAATSLRRTISTHEQSLQREVAKFDQGVRTAVAKMGKAGHTAPDGKPWNLESAYEQLAHHLEQPERHAIPQALAQSAEHARAILDNLKTLEHSQGIGYADVPNYLTHRMRTPQGRERFVKFAQTPGNAARTPFFVKDERFPNIEAMQGARATENDVLAGKAAAVGDPLGLDPETNVARLLQARVRAHGQALFENANRREVAQASGLRKPSPADVAGIPELRTTADLAAGRLRELQVPTDLTTYRERVASRLAQRRGAALGVRVATRKAPALAARQRAGRRLAEAMSGRGEAQAALRTATKAGEPAEVTGARTTLRAARKAVERARKQVVKADRSADPIAMRQAHAELRQAQRAHIEARVAHARAMGTYAGTPAQVRIATRKADKARTKYLRALTDQERVDAVRKELEAMPGKEATPEQWRAIKDHWESVGLPEFKAKVKIPEDESRVLERVASDINASFPDPKQRSLIDDFLRKTTGHWKVLALVSPGYHLRNAYGDSIGAWWAGARNPASFLQAGRIIKNRDNPEKLLAMRIKVGNEVKNGQEVLDESAAMGVHGQGFIGAELGKGQPTKFGEDRGKLAQRMGWARKVPGLKHVPGEGPVSRLSGTVGQLREDSTRLGTYLDLRKQGHSIVDAAERTHTYLFDYGHVSDFIAKARRFWMPFITYTSKAVPRTLKQAVTRPGYFSHHAELANALSSAAGIEPGGPENLPVGQRTSFGIPDPGGILHRLLGMPKDQPILWNPERVSPWGTLNALDPNQVQRGAAANLLNPFAATAIQAPLERRFYYAGNAPKRSVAPPLINALHSLGIPIPDYGSKMSQAIGHAVPGYSSKLDQVARLFPPFSFGAGFNPEDPEGLRRSAASFFAGLPLNSYDRAQLAANAQKYGG